MHPKFRNGGDHIYGCNCRRCKGGKTSGKIVLILAFLMWFAFASGIGSYWELNPILNIGVIIVGAIGFIVYSAIKHKWWLLGIVLIIFGLTLTGAIESSFGGMYLPKAGLIDFHMFSFAGMSFLMIGYGIAGIGVLFLVAYALRSLIRFINS